MTDHHRNDAPHFLNWYGLGNHAAKTVSTLVLIGVGRRHTAGIWSPMSRWTALGRCHHSTHRLAG